MKTTVRDAVIIGSLVRRRGSCGYAGAMGIVTRCEPRFSSERDTVYVWVFSEAHETWTRAWAFDAWWEVIA